MELVAAVTLYGLFSAWLLFPFAGIPRILRRAVALLMALEFVALLAWAYGLEACAREPCGPAVDVARTAAAVDLPALSIAVIALAVADCVRRRRRRALPRRALRGR